MITPAYESAAALWESLSGKPASKATFADLCAVGDAITKLGVVNFSDPEETQAERVARCLLTDALRSLEDQIREARSAAAATGEA